MVAVFCAVAYVRTSALARPGNDLRGRAGAGLAARRTGAAGPRNRIGTCSGGDGAAGGTESIAPLFSDVISEEELTDALIFAAATLVVLPLMPDRYLGPYGAINPRIIWRIVILMMSISAGGYIAVRPMGPRFGLPIAGLASGFVSSTRPSQPWEFAPYTNQRWRAPPLREPYCSRLRPFSRWPPCWPRLADRRRYTRCAFLRSQPDWPRWLTVGC